MKKTLFHHFSAIALYGLLVMTAAVPALAQTIIPGTINTTSPSYINPNAQDVSMVRIGARDYGFHVTSDIPLQMSCLSAQQQLDGAYWPIVLPSNPQYKAFRDTIQLAFAMKRKIRIYTTSCARWGDLPSSMQYPVIYGVDILPETAQ